MMPAFGLIGRIASEPMLLAPTYQNLGADLRNLTAAVPNAQQDLLLNMVAMTYNAERRENKPYVVAGRVAVIPVHGILINRFDACWGFVTGYTYIERALDTALRDPEVAGVMLDVESYGGEAQGCFELCDTIHAARSRKPIRALVYANAYSGGYAIASAAERITITPSGGAGSIGVVTRHVDFSKAFDNDGITVTFVYAGDHKIDGNPYQPLPAAVRADMQTRIDATYGRFVDQVARNRDLPRQAVIDTQARIYGAQDAATLKLVDTVDTPSSAFLAFVSELSQESSPMSNPTTTNAAPAAAPSTPAAAATPPVNERARISAILDCEAAKERPALARHLALHTDLTAEAAQAVLAASATEAKPEAASPFLTAMDKDKHPNVGAGGGGDEEPDLVTTILRDYQAATGISLPKT